MLREHEPVVHLDNVLVGQTGFRSYPAVVVTDTQDVVILKVERSSGADALLVEYVGTDSIAISVRQERGYPVIEGPCLLYTSPSPRD